MKVNINSNKMQTNFSNIIRVPDGTLNYEELNNKPLINDVVLIGNKSLDDLNIVEKENGKGLSSNDYTNIDKTKLQGIQEGANVNTIESISVNGTEQTTDDNKNIELTIPYNTSDLINNDNTVKDALYVHTDNNYTTTEKNKLSNIANGAEVNKIDSIKVNGTTQTITNKSVDITVPNTVTEETVSGWGFTKNTGTYIKPDDGIPKTDLTSEVQTSLGKADNAVQPSDISNFITKDVNNLTYYTKTTDINDALNLKQNITDNTLQTTNKTIPSAINEVNSIAKGANQALSYGNYSTMITAFNALAADVYNVGQNVMIVTLEVPDLWISAIESTSSQYTYTTDEAFINSLKTNGYVQVGYYRLSALETQKVDLTDYARIESVPTELADLSDDSTHRLVTDTEKTTWNGKVDKITGKGLSTNDYTTAEKEKLSGIEAGATANKEYYGTCSTAAATQEKVVVCEGFVLETGATISVLFAKAQTYNGTPTLNVNNTGEIAIQIKSGTNAARYVWSAGEIIDFTYNGAHWIMHRSGLATTTYYGVTKLAASATSTSGSTALTPSALNSVMENIVTGYPVYSASLTYDVGDRVRYSFYVYECIISITEPESWDNEHWKIVDDLQTQINNKQSTLVSGQNIKTINNQSIVGSGNIQIIPEDSYSLTETTVGTWVDGKTIYRRVYSGFSLSQNANNIIDSNFKASNINQLLKMYGSALRDDNLFMSFNYSSRLNVNVQVSSTIDNSNGLTVATGSSSRTFTKGVIIIEYTKP